MLHLLPVWLLPVSLLTLLPVWLLSLLLYLYRHAPKLLRHLFAKDV